MWEAVIAPGSGPPPHIHGGEEESFYVLAGEITFQSGEERFVATAGTFVNMPPGTLHCFTNASDKTARMIISIAPAGLENMFFEVGQSIEWGQPVPAPSQAEIEKLLAVAPRYGIQFQLPVKE
jgi:quercetin dioxygenase-like cupin family protein